MDHEQPPTNQTINATQMERAPSKIPRDNLNISCDFSDTTSNNPSSYTSFAIRRRRNQRRLRHEITINTHADIIFQGLFINELEESLLEILFLKENNIILVGGRHINLMWEKDNRKKVGEV
ncbi:hypothetical protein RhiirA1_467242 [Rhizophagus irregularis]|uniref:Uncharacterized protein n=1 Tax=Rhizophagus irregularis TaxID=588596 RepID=A0A2N0RCE9_9GLOM|nr:hypothetical protein RhiirA1_467242 [Rhizophagus irregularis]